VIGIGFLQLETTLKGLSFHAASGLTSAQIFEPKRPQAPETVPNTQRKGGSAQIQSGSHDKGNASQKLADYALTRAGATIIFLFEIESQFNK
jgi:hypothetical protein